MILNDISPEDREYVLATLASCGDPDIMRQVNHEVVTIMSVIVDEVRKGTRFYQASTMKELNDLKDIFRSILREDVHFQPTPERQMEYVDMFRELKEVEWI